MTTLLPDLLRRSAARAAGAPALVYQGETVTYGALASMVEHAAGGMLRHGLGRGERVAVYLEKRPETLAALFAASASGGAFVPVNPVLRPHQVRHILNDCDVRILVTSADRLAALAADIQDCPALRLIVLIDGAAPYGPAASPIVSWPALLEAGHDAPSAHRVLDTDMTAILYTSGSTGLPKGVVLSHRNIVVGAESVGQYLELTPRDRVLSVLPVSFDYGLNQFTAAFHAGACVVVMNYLLPADVLRTAAAEAVTGLGCVPPLWTQLAGLEWPAAARKSLRYITNTGGAMPGATLAKLRAALPETRVYLMYGLTEAFRSTYLPPTEVERRPGSIGKAIPNAEILVVGPDGRLCGPGEEGELVHRGPLVAMGYWNDPQRTAERFRPSPVQPPEIPIRELAVWSGDTVRQDEDGFLYFVGRRDEMIKTSGYRVSPTEVEEIVHAAGGVGEAAAFGVPHGVLGQAIVVAVTARAQGETDDTAIREHCRRQLPAYMVPLAIVRRGSLPRNPNGKVDRRALAEEYRAMFEGTTG